MIRVDGIKRNGDQWVKDIFPVSAIIILMIQK